VPEIFGSKLARFIDFSAWLTIPSPPVVNHSECKKRKTSLSYGVGPLHCPSAY